MRRCTRLLLVSDLRTCTFSSFRRLIYKLLNLALCIYRHRARATASYPAPTTSVDLFARPHRAGASLRPFASLNRQQRRSLYQRAIQIWEGDTVGDGYLQCGLKAASEANVSVHSLDHALIKQQIYQRASAMGKLLKAVEIEASTCTNIDEVLSEVVAEPNTVDNGDAENHQFLSILGRKGNSGRKRKVLEGVATMDRRFKGAEDHKVYQRAVKAVVADVLQRHAEENMSTRRAGIEMMNELKEKHNVTLSLTACRKHMKAAIATNQVLTPQKPGGAYIPDAIERRIADLCRKLRAQKLPVFRDDVIAWATYLIKNTPAAENFVNGEATVGWYQNWLRRQNMHTGAERPLELTRQEWLSPDNLEKYFKVAAEIMVTAGVAEPNPDYDPTKPYDEVIFITRPWLIASFDETRVNLDSTETSKGKTDRAIRAGPEDDGECIVTKSSSSATSVCGRLGNGKALPVYTVFDSGESFHPAWAPHIVSEIKDKDGNFLPWRYASNEKGSLNEQLAKDYMTTILHPSLGSPPTRSNKPGNQGVVICDGVGTHIGLVVLETALELGLEIILRVPHLSFRLQGEDTVNFSILKVSMLLALNYVQPIFSNARYLHVGAMEGLEKKDAQGDQPGRVWKHAYQATAPQVRALHEDVSRGTC